MIIRILLTLLLAPAVLFVGCGRPGDFQESGKEVGKKEKEEALVLPVEATSVQRGSISSYFETTTRVEAERSVDVSSKSTSRCLEIFVEEGDRVEQGAILGELEKDEALAAFAQSEVQVRQDKTGYDLAKRQFDEGLGSRIDMDNARYAHEQALATLQTQRLQLNNLTIRAPINGVITQRVLQAGMLVSAGDMVFQMVDPESYVLAIAVPEKQLPNLKEGQKAKVTIDSLSGRSFDASIRRINPSVDAVSGTVKVVLDFEEGARDNLRESAFARVNLVMATRQNVLLVPKEALLDDNGQQFVYVLRPRPIKDDEPINTTEAEDGEKSNEKEDSKAVLASAGDDADKIERPEYVAERVLVRLGLEDSRYAQIIFGIEDDALIVTNGQYSLKDGSFARITSFNEMLQEQAELTDEEALERAKEKRKGGGEESESGGNGRRGHFIE